MIRAPLKMAALSAMALATSSRPTISTVKAWRVGMSTALVTPRSRASTRICQTSTVSVTDEPEQDEREHHLDGLGDDQRPPLGQGVRDQPAEQAQDQHRQEGEGGHEAEDERVAGEVQDEPCLGDLLHPGADERHQLADEEQPVVAVAEGPAAVAQR